MIYTVTFNPAIDYIVRMDKPLEPGMTNRSASEDCFFGGKGINVSTVLKNLGIENTALGFAAGFTGEAIVDSVNSKGIIDNSYSGTNDIWKFPALAMRDTVIHEGDRICQFRIMKKQPELHFNEVYELDSTNRGGFGSTGII
jgi:hypothetical protein